MDVLVDVNHATLGRSSRFEVHICGNSFVSYMVTVCWRARTLSSRQSFLSYIGHVHNFQHGVQCSRVGLEPWTIGGSWHSFGGPQHSD